MVFPDLLYYVLDLHIPVCDSWEDICASFETSKYGAEFVGAAFVGAAFVRAELV